MNHRDLFLPPGEPEKYMGLPPGFYLKDGRNWKYPFMELAVGESRQVPTYAVAEKAHLSKNLRATARKMAEAGVVAKFKTRRVENGFVVERIA